MNLSPCPLRRKLCSVGRRKPSTNAFTTKTINNDYWKLAVRNMFVLCAQDNTPKHIPPPTSKLQSI